MLSTSISCIIKQQLRLKYDVERSWQPFMQCTSDVYKYKIWWWWWWWWWCTAAAVVIQRVGLNDVTVAVDGSLYRFHPHFKQLMSSKISQLLPPHLQVQTRNHNYSFVYGNDYDDDDDDDDDKVERGAFITRHVNRRCSGIFRSLYLSSNVFMGQLSVCLSDTEPSSWGDRVPAATSCSWRQMADECLECVCGDKGRRRRRFYVVLNTANIDIARETVTERSTQRRT